jgi:lysophospholipase L1-like esterase
MRVDSIQVKADGSVSLVRGVERKSSPLLPDVAPGALRLANIFMPYRSMKVDPWQVFPVGCAYPEPAADEIDKRSQFVMKTLRKLRDGQPVKVVAWGDSVTVGGDASTPEKRFANLFVARLRERFPASEITLVNAGIGGSTTNHRMPGLEKDVLFHKPDLVTIEFVNDMGIPEEAIRRNLAAAVKRIREIGGEIILVTPHFVMPEWMELEHPRGPETRKKVELLRMIAAELRIGLADTSRRWAHLEVEGIPYIVYLENGINHPDDRGHELFVKDLLTFFPAE